MCDGKKMNSYMNRNQLLTALALNDLCCPFVISDSLVFPGSGDLEVGGLHDIPVMLVTAFWQVVTVHLRRSTPSGQWLCLVCLWATRSGTGAPDLDGGFLAGIGNQSI